MEQREPLTDKAGSSPAARIALMFATTAWNAESEESIYHQFPSVARLNGRAPYSKLEDAAGADAEELVSLEPPLELPLVPEDAEPVDELLVESTVTTHSAETSPTEAVIVALPSAIAVTFHSLSTVATSGASDAKAMPSIDAPSGFAVAVN